MDIGEETKRHTFEPIPVEAPIVEPAPVEIPEPDRELEPV